MEESAEDKEESVTDVVDEQVGSGEVEPVPTPAVGGEAEHSAEEVTDKGGVEQVDEELKEPKVEGGEAKAAESPEAPAAEEAKASEVEANEGESSTPQVTEETTTVTEETTKVESEPVAPTVEPRKQERVEHPTYTLETVGNKYNTGNFWLVSAMLISSS